MSTKAQSKTLRDRSLNSIRIIIERTSTMTRIFFATDVHGSEKCFRKFLSAGLIYKADVMILAGDLTGKMIIPIIQENDKMFSCWFMDNQITVKSEEELINLENTIRDSGFYPFKTDLETFKELRNSPDKLDHLFTELMVKTLERWIRIAEEKLRGKEIKCYISPGNDDRLEIDKVLNSSDFVINPEQKVVEVDSYHQMITFGCSNRTPWNTPRELDEQNIFEKLEELVCKLDHKENAIFNLHCPPFGSGIDSAPKLDDTLKPIMIAGQPQMIPVGSIAVKNIILKHQPLVGLHGHIHESRGAIMIGRTKCFNPGSEYGIGILRGLILNLGDRGIKNYLFSSG